MAGLSAASLGLLRPGATQPRPGEPALPRRTAASGADALLQAARAADAAAIAQAKALAAGPMPAATAAAYQAAMLQRPLVAPVARSERLAAFQTRDLLASRGERVAHAAATVPSAPTARRAPVGCARCGRSCACSACAACTASGAWASPARHTSWPLAPRRTRSRGHLRIAARRSRRPAPSA
jgi:hypothetical protein